MPSNPTPLADTDPAVEPVAAQHPYDSEGPPQRALRRRPRRTAGGPAETLCDLPAVASAPQTGDGLGGTWSANGVLLFSPSPASGIYRISSSGGEPAAVTLPDRARQETSHRFPVFLPDGHHFLYLVRGRLREHRGIFVGSLDSPERTRLIDADSNAAHANGDYVLFAREAALLAQRFDDRRFELVGDPVPIADGIVRGPTTRYAPFAVSGDVVAYRRGGVATTQLVVVDRSGRAIRALGAAGPYPANPSLSPDGRQIAMALFDLRSGGADVWLFDIARGVQSRFTSDASLELAPLWTPDGTRLLFASNRAGVWDLYERPVAERTPLDRLVLESDSNKYPQSWSPDGATLVYSAWNAGTGQDLWTLSMDDARRATPYLQTPFDEREAQVSPDGRWLAYSSNESGRPEVYVRPFPAAAGQWKVSVEGGTEPRWRGDGRELFYVGPDRRLISVPIASGATFTPGLPAPLFETRLADTWWWDYVVLPGGRFVIKQRVEQTPSSRVTVVLNWQAALHR